MEQATDVDGRCLPHIGAVVTDRTSSERRVGVVIDAWPMLPAPHTLKVRWEPLLSGEVSTLAPSEVSVVPLEDR